MWREFRIKKASRVQVWRIRNLGESYETEHGQLNGAFQKFSDTPGDKGKPGTKAYVSAKDNTAFHIQREIRKKEEHGYCEVDKNGNLIEEKVTSISWDKMLPKHLCSYKPQTDIEPKALEKLHAAGKARYTRKIDGHCHLAVHHTWGWEIYTRRMDLASERFPNHIKELESSDFNVGTILVGEMVCLNDGKENFKSVSRICRSDPPEARKLVESGEVPEPTHVIFDILFHNGKDLKDTSYDNRVKLFAHYPPMASGRAKFIASVDYYDVTPKTWALMARNRGWEGFVVTDGSAVPGDKFYSFDGSSKRPKGHHKLKTVRTEDVIVIGASPGTGKRLDGIGALYVAQYHPDTEELFYCGKLGSGMNEENLSDVEKIVNKKNLLVTDNEKDITALDLNKIDGFVIEIEYAERQPKSNKFKFPVFLRVRTDKGPEECVAQNLAEE